MRFSNYTFCLKDIAEWMNWKLKFIKKKEKLRNWRRKQYLVIREDQSFIGKRKVTFLLQW